MSGVHRIAVDVFLQAMLLDLDRDFMVDNPASVVLWLIFVMFTIGVRKLLAAERK